MCDRLFYLLLIDCYLRVCSQSSSANLENGFLIFGVLQIGRATIADTALDTVLSNLAKIKLLEILAMGAEQLGRVETLLQTLSSIQLTLSCDPVQHHDELTSKQLGQPVHDDDSAIQSLCWVMIDSIRNRYKTIL